MGDDIVIRLRGGEDERSPAECWTCGEWGCHNKEGKYTPCLCEEPCECDNECSCNCHSWYSIVKDAANEIERLRKIIVDYYIEERNYQDGINSVDEMNPVYEIPQSWKDAFREFEKEALRDD